MESSVETAAIEWDIPVSEVRQNGEINDGLEFTKLSLGTTMRNKMWEQEQRAAENDAKGCTEDLNRLTAIANKASRTRNNRYISEGQHGRNNGHFRRGLNHYEPGQVTSPNMMEPLNYSPNDLGGSQIVVSSELSAYSPSFHPKASDKESSSPIPGELTSNNGSGEQEFMPRYSGLQESLLQKENQNLRDEISHLKCLLVEHSENRCASVNDQVPATEFADPLRMVLETVKLENSLREKDDECRTLYKKNIALQAEVDKLKSSVEHDRAKHKQELKILNEKLEQRQKEDENEAEKTKYNRREDRSYGGYDDHRGLREKIKQLTEEKKELTRRLDEVNTEYAHKESILQIDLHKHELELKQYKETVNQYQTNGQSMKADLERFIASARDSVDKERQDKYLLLVEQNKVKNKLEKMTETCQGLQMKNEELSRVQTELEQEVDSFRKLKKLIQEHGLPNHDQLILLQQQAESYKEDVLSERKDRERAQAQREKMRRDLDGAQARISSLQEQVYKYQEHIMQLNSEKHRSMGNPTKLQRQLSSPSFVNHRIANSFDKPFMKNSAISPVPGSPQNRPPGGAGGFDDGMGRSRGFRPMYNNQVGTPRGFHDGRRGSSSSVGGGQFDSWQRQGNVNGQSRFHGNFNGNFNGMNNKPRSPLLASSGDHWQNQNQRNSHSRQGFNQHFNSPMAYGNGIWSQQHQPGSPLAPGSGPCSPSGFGPLPSSPASPWLFPPENSLDMHPATLTSTAQGLKPFASEPWSTASVDDLPSPSATLNTGCDSGDDDKSGKEEFVCKKCDSKFTAQDAFKSHLEQCFGWRGVSKDDVAK